MNKISGVVENVSRDGKRVQVDGSWYSVFAASQMPSGGVARGDFVEFTYVQKGEFNNIKGSVEKKEAPASRPTTGAAPASASPGFTNSRGFVEKQFPVPPLHPDRSIIRQNSLTHAVNVVSNNDSGDFGGITEYVDLVIEVARKFEAYSTGDMDNEMAEEAVKLMLASETSR